MIIIAHRGASGTEPENTLRAFRRAVQLGCTWIECDVRMTRDGSPVIIHDATVNRTTDGQGRVVRMTYQALRGLDAGKKEKIPSLREVLLFAKKNKVRVVLEIKDLRALPKTVSFLKTLKLLDQVIISSFSSSVILNAKKINASLATAFIIENAKDNWVRRAERARTDMVHVFVPLVTKEKIHAAHTARLKVWAWTANTLKEALKLRKKGIDGIFTDVPHRLISLT